MTGPSSGRTNFFCSSMPWSDGVGWVRLLDDFLKTSRFYSLPERRWKLPQNYTKLLDTNFYTPFRNIVSSVVRRFWGDAARQRSREVVDTHATDLQHSMADPPAHASRPSLVIKAKGPSFQLPRIRNGEPPAKIGFSNIAACIEIHIDDGERPISEQLARAAIYARYISTVSMFSTLLILFS